MFKSQQRKRKILFGLSDVALTAAAFELAYGFRRWLPLSNKFFFSPEVRNVLLFFSTLTWVAAGYWLNVNGRPDATRIRSILRDSARQVGYGALAFFVFIFFGLRLQYQISRPFLATFIITSWLFLAGFRIAARNLIPAFSREFGLKRYILVVGLGAGAKRLARTLENYYADGVRIVGFLAPPDAVPAPASIQLDHNYPVFPLDNLRAMMAQHVIDEIHFAVESDKLPSLEEVFLWCDEEGVCSRVAIDFFPHINSDLTLERIGDTPFLTFTAAPDDEVLLLAKRIIDVVLALFAMVLLSPVFLIAAALIRLTSPGPVIFRQTRCGLNGRTFTLYKFRSMVVDAEQRLHEVAHLNSKEIVTKIPDDPRLTTVGKWIRRFSIDEIPQLLNVLRGDMSLVGPRPAIPGEVAQYKLWQRRRLRMRPGLTCLWAVHGRDNVDFESWMRLDLQYIDNWSLGLDVRIILMTIPQVLSGRAS
ncbi:MAG TPA: sugar transferase [Terriglobales bacterium]|jgi:exopolysaccharide biosynthesis polyprenyl glycosylphosphotransferase